MAAEIIAMGPEFYANPYPVYDRLRVTDPVHFDARLGWILTRYADVLALADDPRVSRAAVEATRTVGIPTEAIEAAQPVLKELQDEVRAKDPPDHVHLRRLLSKAFTPRMVERLRPRIQQLVDGLLDAVAPAGGMDAIGDFAYPLPAMVIMELLGIPPEDRDLLKAWTDDRVAFLGGISVAPDPVAVARRAGASATELVAYYSGLIARRRQEPREDLISAFIGVEEDGGKLSQGEIVANCIFLLSGGHETTTHLIGNGLLALLRHPDQWHLLRQDGTLVPAAVEELLRYDSPVQLNPRGVTAEVVFGGQTIRPGERLTFAIGAANRDPDHFAEPNQLDARRHPNDHVAFGFDRHFCLGAHLARVEGQVVFATLIERFPNLSLAADTQSLRWQANPSFHGLTTLPVTF